MYVLLVCSLSTIRHILRLRSGDVTGSYSYQDAFNDAVSTISATLSLFSGLGTPIESVVLAGHSWGGGMAKLIANWFNGTHSSIEIAGLVYVDAVVAGGLGHVFDFPSNVSSILNIYQSDFETFPGDLAHGASISNPGLSGFDGTAYYGRYRQYDVDAYGDTLNHTNIDYYRANDVADFILHVLDEWYWDDLLN